MPKPLTITQRQATALMKAAKETGCSVEFEPSTGTVRFFPENTSKDAKKNIPLDNRSEGYF